MEINLIDIQSIPTETLLEYKKKLETEILQKDKLQYAIKIFLNACSYGVFRSEFFLYNNYDVASTITVGGRDLDLFIIKTIKKYFTEFFANDEKLHIKLREKYSSLVENIENIPTEEADSLIAFGDTDSVGVNFNKIIETYFTEKYDSKIETELIIDFFKFRLEKYVEKVMQRYIEKFNCGERILNLEFENVYGRMILLRKKHYIADVAWKLPNIFYKLGSKIKFAGISIKRSTSSIFARKHLYNEVKFILDNADKVNIFDITKRMKNLKEMFMLADINEICESKTLGLYNKYVVNDKSKLTYLKGTPSQVKGAALHNYLLYENSKHKIKYSHLKDGDKLFMYPMKKPEGNISIFSFKQDEFPNEFAPEVDYDTLFYKSILVMMNTFYKVLYNKKVPMNLTIQRSLF